MYVSCWDPHILMAKNPNLEAVLPESRKQFDLQKTFSKFLLNERMKEFV